MFYVWVTNAVGAWEVNIENIRVITCIIDTSEPKEEKLLTSTLSIFFKSFLDVVFVNIAENIVVNIADNIVVNIAENIVVNIAEILL